MKLLSKISAIFCAFMVLATSVVYASPQEVKKDNKDVIEVEVLYGGTQRSTLDEVELDDGTKLGDHEYIVKESPNMNDARWGSYVNYAGWITRNGVVSLSIDPTTKVRNDRGYRDAAWHALASPTHGFASSPKWKNTKVMGWQFDCHFAGAKHKQYWNLEPHRVANSYAYVVLHLCNP